MFSKIRAMFRGAGAVGRSDQKGFTLIEMSIVLAIIGLIIGGILKGQEVVNNGRLKTQVAQMDGIKGAVFTFQDQFSYLPGDYNNATATLGFAAAGSNGDGNGAIGLSGALTMLDTDTEVGSEAILAWAHMIAANLLSGISLPNNTAVSAITEATTGLTYPGKMNNTFLWLGSFLAAPPGGNKALGTMVRLQAVSSGKLTAGSTPQALREQDAYNLDRKYDDGSPMTGSIISDSISDQVNCLISGGGYSISTTGSPTNTYCTLLWVVQ